ncbi:MAG: glycoside hydrolase family 2 TIM barrel-domain containing protein [Chitinophaga sp.]
MSLNGSWHFRTDPAGVGERSSWYAEDLDASGWDSMPVPGNWDLRNEYAHYTGKGWYRTRFSIAPASNVRLLFEAVNYESKVWLNGHLLGTNDIGSLPFEFEITRLLHDDQPNTLVVLADNTMRRGAVWSWGGIRRPVTLLITDPLYIVSQKITPRVDLQKRSAEITVRLDLKNGRNKTAAVQGKVILSAKNGFKRTLPFSTDIEAGGQKETVVRTVISGDDYHLWGIDDPFLYESHVIIAEAGKTLDNASDRFGLRKIEIDNKNLVFLLNGEPQRLMGLNLVPDDRTTGNTLPLWRIKEDIDLIKQAGGNMARLSHLPLHKEVLDYLDEKGMLIFSEVPLWGFDQQVSSDSSKPKEWLTRLIADQYNHACIIGWTVGNEIGYVPGVNAYVSSAIDLAKTLDSTRMAVVVSHTAPLGPNDPVQYADFALVNTYDKYTGPNADAIHKLYPEKPIFYAEFGYDQLKEDLDGDIDARAMVEPLRFKPYCMGASLWTFNDYRSAYPGMKGFSENRTWGIVDVFRQKKKAWYSVRKEFAPVRGLAVKNITAGKNASGLISIEPRKKLDLPAYILKGYKVVWKLADRNDSIVDGGFKELPVISPGDAPVEFPVSWETQENLYSLNVALVSPLNYQVLDTTVFFDKPDAPEIICIEGGRGSMNSLLPISGSVRVVFDKVRPACRYKLRYGRNGLEKETSPTLNNYIEVSGLDIGKEYSFSLVALNGAFESEPSKPQVIKIGTEMAPPLIRYTEPADKGFYAGYLNGSEDYLFQLQYTTQKGNYAESPVMQAANKGVFYVGGLENGQTYYYRARLWKHNTYITPWSREMTVVPDGDLPPAAPRPDGVLRMDGSAVICFRPVKKATGYIFEYRLKGSAAWEQERCSASRISYYTIGKLHRKKEYEFRIAAVNSYGRSSFSKIISVKP